ncbi:SRPBCC domain-containing protein [Aureispira anguillae]|uniref:SRPBCC domain-containing protein n=1 Tax=Aureispira anguillae TaxID=2864201 RepID=A0A916DX71_9BACT|nr:SRPBCC domain-containing protein [Aureispira anguillae]BDS15460.1 SRPBCC domain-containing protein [Aureispira anguillae]
MKSCHTQTIINAPISKVWAILTDFDRYPEWNPLVGKVWGTVKEGRIVFAHILPLKNVFPIQIISLKKQQKIVWKGTLLNASIMMGEHYYELKDLGNNQTELQHGERFSGWASQWLNGWMLTKLQDSYKYHNQKLKIIAEQGTL